MEFGTEFQKFWHIEMKDSKLIKSFSDPIIYDINLTLNANKIDYYNREFYNYTRNDNSLCKIM